MGKGIHATIRHAVRGFQKRDSAGVEAERARIDMGGIEAAAAAAVPATMSELGKEAGGRIGLKRVKENGLAYVWKLRAS